MSGLVYLASPYSHPDPAIRTWRYQQAVRAAAKLMEEGEVVFSPIAHSHAIGLEIDMEQDLDFWMLQDIAILRHCAEVKVLMIPGWDVSKGVRRELALAGELDIPVHYIELETLRFEHNAPPADMRSAGVDDE